MRILIVTQYFWPEQFRINNIVENLLEKGHAVDVITGVPNYPKGKIYDDYKVNKNKYSKFFKANVFRVPVVLRGEAGTTRLFLNYLSFVLSAIFFGSYQIRQKKYDIVFTFATSPITVALPSIFFCFLKNAKHILWVLDIWPYILKELKLVKNKVLLFFLSKIVNYIYLKSDIILAQSESFKKVILEQIKDKNKVFYFPSWNERFGKKDRFDQNHSLDLRKYKKKFNIVFTGNVGEAQNFDNIILAAEIIKDETDIQWLVVGTGRKIEDIKKKIEIKKIKNFFFIDQQQLSNVPKFHKIASVLLVSLCSDKYLSMTVPGKVQTYMASKKFILGFVGGETANMLQKSQAGISVNPSNPKLLAKTIVKLKNNPAIINRVISGNFGTRFVKKNFDEDTLMSKLNEYLLQVLESFVIIRNVKSIPFDRNFSLSGLNLAFLGYWSKKKIRIRKEVYLWPDGFFYKRFFYGKNMRKIPGREIVSNIKIPKFIKKIYIIGNLDIFGKKYLENIYQKEIVHIPVGHESIKIIFKKYCKIQFLKTDLIYLTLPTPKQEELSEHIMNHSKFYKILCIGGAINMASGAEKPVPILLEKMNLEFLWRLRTDTARRLRRLFISGFYYMFAELRLKFKGINKRILHEQK